MTWCRKEVGLAIALLQARNTVVGHGVESASTVR